MANPRQRKKAKAKSAIVKQSRRQKQKLRKKKALRGPVELLQSWDSKKTVSQNYAALGLAPSLRIHIPGGTESETLKALPANLCPESETVLDTPDSQNASINATQHGRIIRDEDGNIVSVELPEEPCADNGAKPKTPWGRPFADDLKLSDIPVKTPLIKSLEHSQNASTRKCRYASNSEVATLRSLIVAHGENIEAMAHDRRRNPMQRTAGQIKAAIRKAGGFEFL